MKSLIAALLLLAPALPAAAAYEDEGLSEVAASTEAVSGADDEDQPVVQESDEDLADFVTDYVKKDIQLKGSFLLEDKQTGKVLKLELVSVDQKAADGENGVKKVKVSFKDAAGKKFTAFFHLQNGAWGGLDIFRIELKGQGPAPALKQGKK